MSHFVQLNLFFFLQFLDEKGHTPLIKAVLSNKTSVAKLWIDAGANLNAEYTSLVWVKANLYDSGEEGGEEERLRLISNPLIAAIDNADLDLVKHMGCNNSIDKISVANLVQGGTCSVTTSVLWHFKFKTW